jgi:DeoR/GlpR family transcriptional regulator of sugar metabolism
MGKLEYRKDQLVDLLRTKGELLVQDVAKLYDISMPSARRLCAQLEREKKVIRTHGGIHSISQTQAPYAFDVMDSEFNQEKEAIANHAVKLVKNRQCVFLDAGTTLKHFAMALASHIKENSLREIMVFTNSLVNLEILDSVCKVIVIGGLYRPERRDFCGLLSEKAARSLRFDICFLGADGVNLEYGVMALDSETARIDELLIKHCAKSVLLADSGKFSRQSLISICPVKEISEIITDSKLSPDIQKEYTEAGVRLVCV